MWFVNSTIAAPENAKYCKQPLSAMFYMLALAVVQLAVMTSVTFVTTLAELRYQHLRSGFHPT